VASRWDTLVVDARDPARLARWWANVLDYHLLHEESDEVEVGPAERTYPRLLFIVAAEAKAVKNRLHLDLRPDDQAAEVERLVDMGARQVDIGQGDVSWVVLADPEGNEFCVLKAS
jgi:hypothetical protein